MSFYALSALTNAIVTFILGSIVLSKSLKNKTNLLFSILAFDVSLWSITYFIWQTSINSQDSLFWTRALMFFAIFIPPIYIHFVFSLAGVVKEKFKLICFNYLYFTVFAIFNLSSSLFISHVEPVLSFKYWPMAGPLFSVFLIVWFFYMLYAAIYIYKKQREMYGLSRIQLQYMLWGLVIGLSGGATNYFLWYRIAIPPLGNSLVLIFIILTAYAVIRHRFLNITLVARQLLLYLTSTLILFLLINLSIVFTHLILHSNFITFNLTLISAGSLCITLISPIIFHLSAYLWDKVSFGKTISYQESLIELSKKLPRVIELNQLSLLIISTLIKTIGLSKAALFILDNTTAKFSILNSFGFHEHNGTSLINDIFLTQYLEKTQKILVREELEKIAKDDNYNESSLKINQLIKDMTQIEAKLIIPLIVNNKLISLIILGNKKGGDSYSTEDIKLLEVLASEAAVAIENAKNYEEIKRFNITLEQEVEKSTKEMKKIAAEIYKKNVKLGEVSEHLSEANDKLQALDKLKDEFVSLASHELRTPMTAIKSYLWLFLDKNRGKLSNQESLYLERAYEATDRLIKLVNEMLNVSRIESGRMAIFLKPVSIIDIAHEVIEEEKPSALKGQVTLNLIIPDNSLPKVLADPNKISEVLTNLIGNSLKFTSANGKISVSFQVDNEMLVTKIADTGKGIRAEDIPKLFHKFGTVGNNYLTKLNVQGTGLGLYLSKSIIELHGGKILVQSPGEGLGSTFSFSLKIAADNQATVPVEVISALNHDSSDNPPLPVAVN
jgi:signal transduction histidine kinase